MTNVTRPMKTNVDVLNNNVKYALMSYGSMPLAINTNIIIFYRPNVNSKQKIIETK